jgi:hypothetical protein
MELLGKNCSTSLVLEPLSQTDLTQERPAMTFFSKIPFYRILLIVEIISLLFKSSRVFAKNRQSTRPELDMNERRQDAIVDGILATLRHRESQNVIYLKRDDVAG